MDHKPTDYMERDRIIKAGGEVVGARVNGIWNLSRAFGDSDAKRNKRIRWEDQIMSSECDCFTFNATNGVKIFVCFCKYS